MILNGSGFADKLRAKVEPEIGGDWMAALSYKGPRGKGQVSFSVIVSYERRHGAPRAEGRM